MAGLLQRAVGGMVKGLGDSMVDQAKADRQAAIVALARTNAVADRDAGFAHQDASQAALFGQQDKTLATTEAGSDRRLGVTEQGANDRQAVTEQGATTRLGISEAGSNSRNASSIAASAANTDKTIAANKETADTAASQFADVKPSADGSFVGINKKGQSVQITDQSGRPVVSTNDKVPPSVAAALLKTHTTLDPDTGSATVDMPAYLKDIGEAQKQYANKPEPYISRDSGMSPPNLSASTMDAPSGGMTSNLFGKPQAAPVADKAYPAAPPAALDYLKKNPSQAAAYDEKYGQGAAARALGK